MSGKIILVSEPNPVSGKDWRREEWNKRRRISRNDLGADILRES